MSDLFFEYVDVSDTNTGWPKPVEKDYGCIPGFVRGFNVEFKHKDTEEIVYGSCIWDPGNIEDYFQQQIDDWGDIGFVLFEAEKSKGYEPTGRAVFRGYGREVYDPTERDFCIEDANVQKWLRQSGLTLKAKIDRHASIYDNTEETKKNEYYETSDEWFTYYVNKETGEKKFELEEGDVLVNSKQDDFTRKRI